MSLNGPMLFVAQTTLSHLIRLKLLNSSRPLQINVRRKREKNVCVRRGSFPKMKKKPCRWKSYVRPRIERFNSKTGALRKKGAGTRNACTHCEICRLELEGSNQHQALVST